MKTVDDKKTNEVISQATHNSWRWYWYYYDIADSGSMVIKIP